ncbi:MAG: anti-sigma factor family protein [Candidatus Zipacnadales bacterium]
MDRLTALAEGELPAEEALQVRAHLAECAECGTAWREVTALLEELHRLPVPQPPVDLRPRITMALNGVEVDRFGHHLPGHRSLWEITGPYLAAAAVIALAFALATVLTKPRSTGRVARVLEQTAEPSLTQPPEAEGKAKVSTTERKPTALSTKEQEAAEAARQASKAIQDLQEREAMLAADEALLWPEQTEPGHAEGVASHLEMAGGTAQGGLAEPPGTTPGTFSAPLETTGKVQSATAPTQIEIRFRPPAEPLVGQTVYGHAEISAQETLASATVSATGDSTLAIDKPGGVLYEGPLRAGETVTVPVPMTASKAGLHELAIKVEADAPGAHTEVKAFVPNFREAAEPRPQPSPADKPINLVFKNTPLRQALLDVAKQAGLRLEMAEDLGHERVSRDVRGVPARAALRALAEAGGYVVEEVNGVFRIRQASESRE